MYFDNFCILKVSIRISRFKYFKQSFILRVHLCYMLLFGLLKGMHRDNNQM